MRNSESIRDANACRRKQNGDGILRRITNGMRCFRDRGLFTRVMQRSVMPLHKLSRPSWKYIRWTCACPVEIQVSGLDILLPLDGSLRLVPVAKHDVILMVTNGATTPFDFGFSSMLHARGSI